MSLPHDGHKMPQAMMLVIPAYCMGIVLENSMKRRIKQADQHLRLSHVDLAWVSLHRRVVA